MIAFFEPISASAPHIYISALPLSPPTSMVHKTYKQYACPLARVVHGLQASWDPVVATVYDGGFGYGAVWSPCNRFFAVSKPRAVEIRDATTLNLISNFESSSHALALSFSPDSRFLTQFHDGTMVTYDLQTGVEVITAHPTQLYVDRDLSPAYSMDGKMLVAGYFDLDSEKSVIITHDFSAIRTHSYHVSEGHLVSQIWTHGEFLRFATVKSGCITIWQAEFTFVHPPEVVKSLPAPDELTDEEADVRYLFLPTISRLAIALRMTLLVWDAHVSKCLLKISDASPFAMSFSSDGRFFACGLRRGADTGIYIWKKSPAGYIVHQKLSFDDPPRPLLSPNGESIILSGNSTIRLLHTEDPFLSSRTTLDMAQHTFILNLSPNDALAAIARHPEKIVTILDLQSGNPQLEIDTGIGVKCLGVAGDTVLVAGQQEVATWKLDTRNARGNIHDSIRIPMFDPLPNRPVGWFYFMSVSSDLTHIITLGFTFGDYLLAIYDVSTGRCLAGSTSAQGVLKPLSTRARFKSTDINGHVGVETAWFTPDRREIWGFSFSNSPLHRWEVVEDGESDTTRLQLLTATACPPGGFPWQSSHGYEVTRGGWVLSPTQKRLLWLPHPWRSVARYRTWGGRFLGLFHSSLPEVVILEFLD